MRRFAAVVLLLVGACGGGHLGGNDFGKRVRAAQDAQAEGKGDHVRVDAEDAKQTLRAQREVGGKQEGESQAPALILGGGSMSSGGSSSKGGNNPINLEGVR